MAQSLEFNRDKREIEIILRITEAQAKGFDENKFKPEESLFLVDIVNIWSLEGIFMAPDDKKSMLIANLANEGFVTTWLNSARIRSITTTMIASHILWVNSRRKELKLT